MEETLISFETAKLAKEKGFKLQSNAFGYVTKFYNHNTHSLLPFGRTGRTDLTKAYYAPTQGLLQKWLREKHDIHIRINICGLKGEDKMVLISYSWDLFNTIDCIEHKKKRFNIAKQTYEEALEAGLFEGLKLIK